jgi:methionyl-tRNA formyltransferase
VNVNEASVVDELAGRGSDLLLSVYYTQLFAPSLLDAVSGLRLNFHPSLLPRHRGTAPLVWAIVDGDEMTGLSVHELDRGVDTGAIWWQSPLRIHPDDTGYTLHLKAAALVRAIAADLLRRLISGHPMPEPVPQVGEASVHTSRDPQVNRIDWAQRALRVRNIVRALAAPLPGAQTSWRGLEVGIEEVALASSLGSPQAPGVVGIDPDGGVLVWAGDGPVRLVAVRTEQGVGDVGDLIRAGLRTGELFT